MSKIDNFIQLQNKAAIVASLRSIQGDVQDNVIAKMKKGGQEVKKALRASLPQGGGNPSSAGSVPHSQSGELVSKIQATVMPLMLNEPITLKIYITGKAFYARMLEFGTSKMAARPFFYSGAAKLFPSLKNDIKVAMGQVIAKRNARKKKR